MSKQDRAINSSMRTSLWKHYAQKSVRGGVRSWLALCEAQVKLLGLLLAVSCSHVFYQPIKGVLWSPEQVKLTPEEVWLESKDGTRLHAWAFRAQAELKGTVLLFHGNAENMSSHFLNLAWMIKQGYDLLVFDYRGYGFSEGEPYQKGIYEDALRGMEWAYLDSIVRQSPKLIFFGQSLGGQISARAIVDFPHRDAVDLFVMDSTFESYQDIGFLKLRSLWLTWPLSPLAYFLVSDEYASEKYLGKIRVPTLVISGKKDRVIPWREGKKIYKKLKTQKWFWKLPRGGHTDVFHHDKLRYRQRFLDLLGQLRQAKKSR